MKRIVCIIIVISALFCCLVGCNEDAKGECEHDIKTHPGKFPTCTEIGWDNYEYCTGCDYTTYKEKAALGHYYEDGKCFFCGKDEVIDTPIVDID